jgi:hypothetical protein
MVNLDFDIDVYLNPLIPQPWLRRLPKWVNWWFGYRTNLACPVPTVFIWFWTFLGCFSGISVVQAVFERSPYFVERHVPGIVGSFVRPPCAPTTDCPPCEANNSAGIFRGRRRFYCTGRFKPRLHSPGPFSSAIPFRRLSGSASRKPF